MPPDSADSVHQPLIVKSDLAIVLARMQPSKSATPFDAEKHGYDDLSRFPKACVEQPSISFVQTPNEHQREGMDREK
jgi:hypothetical protein